MKGKRKIKYIIFNAKKSIDFLKYARKKYLLSIQFL